MSLYWLCSREGDFSGQNEIFLRNVTKAVWSGRQYDWKHQALKSTRALVSINCSTKKAWSRNSRMIILKFIFQSAVRSKHEIWWHLPYQPVLIRGKSHISRSVFLRKAKFISHRLMAVPDYPNAFGYIFFADLSDFFYFLIPG